jgi:PhoPQ-activated pathogenicity-related protein
LFVEQLENRLLLDAGSAWHNPLFPMDVNNDGIVGPADLAQLLDYLRVNGVSTVPARDPKNPPQFYYDVNGDGVVSPFDALILIDRLQRPTIVTLTTELPSTAGIPSPSSVSVTPQVTVTATSPAALPNGRVVEVDVDLNNDGSFTGSEVDYSQGTLYNGSATFDLTPALPSSAQSGPYQVRIRAHVEDADGVVGYSPVQLLTINTTPSNALEAYVQAPDPSYNYTRRDTTPVPGLIGTISVPVLYTIYDYSMTSQTWRTTADVNDPVWQHWLRIFVPSARTGPVSPTALLLIDGGSYDDSTLPPNPDTDPPTAEYGQEAAILHSVVVDLQDVPNEPLTFTGDPGDPRSEDAILAYTFNQFMNNIGQAGNDTWPALLPMVKSAVRAMDTVQAVMPQLTGDQISNFMVTGYSKRGWTTWLTAAVDSRVIGIIPGVFDNLDQAAQMVHQYEVYGFFSQAVQDYNDFNIFGQLTTPQGQQLSSIVDPYYYLNEPRFATMPKLLINAAGDEFFVSDSAQFYFHDLQGTQNYLRYIPNDGHGLDPTNPVNSTISFYDAVINHLPLPQFSWTVQPDGSIRVQTVTAPSKVLLWQATNPVARDFRQYFNPTIVWTSSVLADQGNGVYVGSTPMPTSGATAFFVELTFPSTIPGNPFVFTTEIHVNTNLPLYSWPPPPIPPVGAIVANASSVQGVFSDVASLLAAPAVVTPAVAGATLPIATVANSNAINAVSSSIAAAPMLDAAMPGRSKSFGDDCNTELVDQIFRASLDDELA